MNQQESATQPGSLGVAIIGCGYWGVNYVRVFSELPGAHVAAICEADGERLHEIGRRYPEATLTRTVDQAINLDHVDAVVICTGATTHYQVARQCLLAGKHVLIEKPLATDVTDARKLIDLAERCGVTLMVGHTFMYNAGIHKIKRYIDQGDLGHVRYLYARRTNLGPIRRDVNALWDLAPHDISIFNYLIGSNPQWVSAVGMKVLGNAREDVGFASVGYPGDIVANVHVSWVDPNKVRDLVVVGSDKRVAFDDVNATERIKVFEKGVTAVPAEASNYGEFFQMRDGDIISPKVESSEPLKNQSKHFVECVTQGIRPTTDGQAGLDVVRVMAAIDRSIELKGAPVSLEDNLNQVDPALVEHALPIPL